MTRLEQLKEAHKRARTRKIPTKERPQTDFSGMRTLLIQMGVPHVVNFPSEKLVAVEK